MQCKNCGFVNPDDALFCANCGSRIAADAITQASTVEPGTSAPTALAAEKYANFRFRLLAAIVDSIAVYLISYIILSCVTGRFLGYFAPGTSFWFLLYWLYSWLFIGLKGQTPGKMLLRIKVIRTNGDEVGLGRAALREILGKMISSTVLLLGFFWIIWDNQKQGWHDKIANTYVVKAGPKS